MPAEGAAVDNVHLDLSTRMSLILLLPKGIVKNDEGIAGSIESINRDPLDSADIAKFWKGTSLEGPCKDGINMKCNSIYYN